MELFALDKDFNIVSQFVATNIQWNRKYYEHGDFSIQIPLNQYSSDMAYVYTKDRKEVGMINKVSYSDSNSFQNVQLSGFEFLDIIEHQSLPTGELGRKVNEIHSLTNQWIDSLI